MSDEKTDNPVDRRKYTRYEVADKAQIFFDAERKLVVDVSDLSYEGLCVEADSAALVHMLPPIDSAGGYDKVPLRLCFDVLLEGVSAEIKLLLSSVHLKPAANSRSQLGLEVVDVEQGILEFSDYIVGLRNKYSDAE
jgi:hypothetical protein